MIHGPLIIKGGFLVVLLGIVAAEAIIVSASAQWALTVGIGITAVVTIWTGYLQVLARRDANQRADRAEELRLAKEKKDEENRKAEVDARKAVAAQAQEAAKKVEQVAKTLETTDTKNDKQNQQTSESLDLIHKAVNSTLFAAITESADAKKLAYMALKRIYEMPGSTTEDKTAMDAAKEAADQAAGKVRDKAEALKLGQDVNAKEKP